MKGREEIGREIESEVLDIVRSEVEKCDNPQGFQSIYGRSGGHGGIGSLLASKLRDEFPSKTLVNFSVFPSESDDVLQTVKEQMYSLLATESERESTDLCFVLNNIAMTQIAQNTLGIEQPAYSDLNWIAAMSMYFVVFCDSESSGSAQSIIAIDFINDFT